MPDGLRFCTPRGDGGVTQFQNQIHAPQKKQIRHAIMLRNVQYLVGSSWYLVPLVQQNRPEPASLVSKHVSKETILSEPLVSLT